MANTKSAAKRARQNDKRRVRNASLRAHTKTLCSTAVEKIRAAKDAKEKLAAFHAAERALQKAVSKGVMPKERASRKTSRIAALL